MNKPSKKQDKENEDSKTDDKANKTGKQTVRIALVGSKGVGKSTIFENIAFTNKTTKKLNSKVT